MNLQEAFAKRAIDSRLRTALRAKGYGSGLSDKSCLLLDNSGSMSGSPLKQLNEVAANFTDCRRFKFSTTCEELKPNEDIPNVEGGTAMHLAFLKVKSLGIEHVVLITDGQPDNETAALTASQGLKVDVFYIGPDPAPAFLSKLCMATGGQYGKASLEFVRELTSRVRERLQLSDGKGAIAL